MFRYLAVRSAVSVLAVLGSVLFPNAQAAPQVPVPPAGTYVCQLWSMAYDAYAGMHIEITTSVLRRVVLDAKGNYRLDNVNGGPGKYTYEAAKGKFTFTTGKMAAFGVKYEYTDDGFKEQTFRLQLFDKGSGEESRTSCALSSKSRGQPLTNVPQGAGVATGAQTPQGRVGNPNPGLKGTLVFFETYNVSAIQSLDLATGKKQTRLSGTDPWLARNGELVYVNRQNEIVIADKNYQRQLTVPRPGGESGEVSAPALSPDGGRVAYYLHAYPNFVGVVVRSRQGQELARYDFKKSPVWLPDGQLLLAENAGYEGHAPALYLIGQDLKALRKLPVNIDDLSEPALSPDGGKIAFISNGDVWVVKIDGSGLKQRTSTDEGESAPVWSPDGLSLAFTVDQAGVLRVLGPQDRQSRPVLDEQGSPVQAGGRMFWR